MHVKKKIKSFKSPWSIDTNLHFKTPDNGTSLFSNVLSVTLITEILRQTITAIYQTETASLPFPKPFSPVHDNQSDCLRALVTPLGNIPTKSLARVN